MKRRVGRPGALRPRWGDIVLAAVTVAVALGLWGVAAQRAADDGGAPPVAVIRDAAGKETRWPLDPEQSREERTLHSGAHTYVLQLEQGRIRVLSADCPDQVCVRTGWLSRPGQTAACVPGRLLIRIVPGPEDGPGEGEVDVVLQ